MTYCDADVAAARGGDDAARDRVLRELWPRAFRLALSIAGDRVTAEDAAQDALVLVAARLADLRDAKAYPRWSARIVVNAARTAVRRRRRDLELANADCSTSFEEAVAQRLDVLAAVATLPDWLRVPLVLRHVEGLSSREIGAALGAPAATIRFRLVLGRRRLAAALAVAGATSQEEYA